jgi:predicted regulator of Ras-like GTPase activity (Roadblock/LC7/MglB family)
VIYNRRASVIAGIACCGPEEAALSFKSILEKLVSSLPGVQGALLLEADGESVAWCSKGDPELLRLRGAYIAVMLRTSETAAREFSFGTVEHLAISYEGASLLAQLVGGGYFVVLEMEPLANLGEAQYRLKPFVELLRVELDG